VWNIEVTLEESDDEFAYDEVPMDDDDDSEIEDVDGDFEKAMQAVKRSGSTAAASVNAEDAGRATTAASTLERPELVDDYIRNFLVSHNMHRSLEAFQAEWHELKSSGKLPPSALTTVPDVYAHNQQLAHSLAHLESEVQRMTSIAEKARGTWDKFRKERDFHRMHHKRVAQEKNVLINQIKRLQKHIAQYEPTMAELHQKYESAMKEKMLTRIERDRLSAKVQTLMATLNDNEPEGAKSPPPKDKDSKEKSLTSKEISQCHQQE